jgi:hypothetical protein
VPWFFCPQLVRRERQLFETRRAVQGREPTVVKKEHRPGAVALRRSR